jgi:hypothetical protein
LGVLDARQGLGEKIRNVDRANSRKKFLEKGIFTSEKRAIKACLTQEHIFFGCNVTP